MNETFHPSYEPIALSGESTVVSEYFHENDNESNYQSEADLEKDFIRQLEDQAYEHLPINNEDKLISNLREQLEKLNDIKFSDNEWDNFYKTKIASTNEGILEKTNNIQNDYIQLLEREDGSKKNVYLLSKDNIHNNCLQVINQYESSGIRTNRYDVTVLVNGLPLVHIELKRRGVKLREAFNQIERYQRDSFWAGTGLFEYVQLFVISNGTHTKYYSNTVRNTHLNETRGRNRNAKRRTSNSFSFTSWWADAKNNTITDLKGFTKTFFAKHSLLNILTKYCVFDVDQNLLVMRPYQIAAVERMLQRVQTSGSETKKLGKIDAGGYIWHATGSGKTLTSFKAAQIAYALQDVNKVIFVVDRKDLDYQTVREYEKFKKGSANSNTSTEVLQKQLEDSDSKIIITTIQKLNRFVSSNPTHQVYNLRNVIIFDECHRSQFGRMHLNITRAFKRYHLFGFTGTPIFSNNSNSPNDPMSQTTEQVFGDKLHDYTIVDAINDKNVLPFRIDYINTVRAGKDIENKAVNAIDTERALNSPERIEKVVEYLLKHFEQKTMRKSRYKYHGKSLDGFNAIFATSSIDSAKLYYTEIAKQQSSRPDNCRLKVGLIYSYAANEEQEDGLLGDEQFETESLDKNSRDFLDSAINDYNKIFKTTYDTSSEKFQNYYKDISMRLKEREIDLVIVVNMFLTGFDATTLNTLWIDNNLRMHGLIQAYSRTNRILNSVKTYGNIVSFRNLETQTNEALAAFGNKDAKSIVLLKPYAEYADEYKKKVIELLDVYPLDKPIKGENARNEFVNLFGSILRLRNILTSFDEFEDNNELSDRDFQNYQSLYLDIYTEVRKQQQHDREIVNDDLVFEIELIKQIEVNVDYILFLVEEAQKAEGTMKRKEIHESIKLAIKSSPSFRDKRDLIDKFLDSISAQQDVRIEWRKFIETAKQQELCKIIESENLNSQETEKYMDAAFQQGELQTVGTAITRVLPPISRFSGNNIHSQNKQKVLEQFNLFFDRFFGLG